MNRNIVSIFFSIIFLVFISAPTIISMVDDSIDVSLFYTSTEEEEKGQEKNKDNEVLFFEFIETVSDFDSNETEYNSEYYFKNYPKPHLNLISPPPQSQV